MALASTEEEEQGWWRARVTYSWVVALDGMKRAADCQGFGGACLGPVAEAWSFSLVPKSA